MKKTNDELNQKILLAKQEWERTFDSINGPVCIIDCEHKIKRLNKAMADLIEIPVKEAIGVSCYKAVHKTDMPPENCPFQKCIKDGEINKTELNVKGIWYEVIISPVLDSSGVLTACVHVMHDITERKKSEEKIRLSEQRFKDLLETTTDWLWEIDTEGRYTYSSPRVKEILGYEPSEMYGKHFYDFMPEDEAEKINELFKKALPVNQHIRCLENINIHKDGHLVFLETNAVPFFNEAGVVAGYRGIDRDISRRKESETELKESELKYRNIVENTHDAVIIDDVDGNLVFANKQFFQLFGFSPDELNSLKLDDYIAPEFLPMLRERHYARIRGESVPAHFEYQGLRRGGERLWLEVNVVARLDSKGKVINTQSTIRDITERKKVEAALREREKYLDLVLQTTQDGFLTITSEGKIIDVNQTYCQMSGYTREELLSFEIRDIDVFFAPEEIRTILKSIIEDGSMLLETQHRRKDGTLFDLEVSASFLGNENSNIISFCRNITERKKQQEYLFNMEKYETLSIMTRGIAHDFNNLLTGIYNYIHLANAETKDKGISFYLDKTLNTIDRAKNLSMQLLTFTGNCPPIKKRHSIFPFIKDIAEFILCGTNISCQFNIPKRVWKCYFDKNQIGQVFDNIIINAKQAMPDGGKIVISAENVGFRKNEDSVLRRGNYVKISISDNGTGIRKEVLQKIFDPFFSTKQQGTGLGLSTAASIIKMHNGKINVDSEPGRGSTFNIYLPASLKAVSENEKIQEIERVHRGQGRILIMDDEECVRQSLKLILENMGYCVDSVRNGEKALELFRDSEKNGHPYVAVILDLTISSGMNGIETVKQIRLINQEIPIFASSGYSDIQTLDNLEEYGFNDYLPKPYLTGELGSLLNQYLINYSTEVIRRDSQKSETESVDTTPMRADKANVLISETIHAINNQNHVIMLNSSVVKQAIIEILEIVKTSQYGNSDVSVIGLPVEQAVETLAELVTGIEKGSKRIKEIIQDRK